MNFPTSSETISFSRRILFHGVMVWCTWVIHSAMQAEGETNARGYE